MKNTMIRKRPTQGEMDIIESCRGMMFSFMHYPDCVYDIPTSKAFVEGWLAGLGLKASPRLALVMVPPGLDLEEYQELYLEQLEKDVTRNVAKVFKP